MKNRRCKIGACSVDRVILRGLVMNLLKKVAGKVADFFEIWLPEVVFIALFLAFLINVFFRYVMHNPQNWTFEFSIISFVVVGLLGACAAYRKEDHVVFDLLYSSLGPRGKNILRMMGYVLLIVLFLIALPGTIRYILKLRALTSIMRIPLKYVFATFPILLISTIIRSAYRLVLDFKSFLNKTYEQTYNTKPKDRLI